MRARGTVWMAFAAAVAMSWPADAQAIPSFTRNTGLTCNQCHLTWVPFPDFTFTGRKFRLNGYRAPWVSERIEAGEEGALSGKRLALGLQNAFSLRYRSDLLSQSKAASDPTKPEPDVSPVRSDPGSTISIFYAGPIGENFGIWNEFYFAEGGAQRGDRFRLVTFDEYDVKFVLNPGDHILGLAMTTQAFSCLSGFCPFSSGVASHMQRGGFNTAGTPYVNFAAYGLFNDRFMAAFGVQPGEDNLDYDQMNYMGSLAYWFSNSDYRQIVAFLDVKAGNDAIPIVTSTSLGPQHRLWDYRNAVRGLDKISGRAPVSSTSTAGAKASYMPVDLGDFLRTKAEFYYNFVDRGPHSINAGIGLSVNRDTYEDGAEVTQSSWGGVVRYFYDRTWGLIAHVGKTFSYEYQDPRGKVYDIPSDISFRGYLLYRPAMNVGVFWSFGNSQASVVEQNWRNGWTWNLQLDFMF